MVSRILALDYGTKRIGVALSDELGWTAQPLETFERRTLDRDIAHIASLVQFAAKLEEGISVPIVFWDERMTTKAAEDFLIAADVSRKKRKGTVDRVAATLLLQSYLTSLESAGTTEAGAETGADSTDIETSDETQGHSGSSAGRGHRSRHGGISGDSVG